MNLPSPAEQLASRKRLAATFYSVAPKPAPTPKIRPAKQKVMEWPAVFPMPCYADTEVKADIFKASAQVFVNSHRVIYTVAAFYGVPAAEIVGPRRQGKIVFPRHVAFYLCKTLIGKSLPEIGRRFGNRDHSTILSGCRRIESMADGDPAFTSQLQMLARMIEGRE